jgi:hypothetical protein
MTSSKDQEKTRNRMHLPVCVQKHKNGLAVVMQDKEENNADQLSAHAKINVTAL